MQISGQLQVSPSLPPPSQPSTTAGLVPSSVGLAIGSLSAPPSSMGPPLSSSYSAPVGTPHTLGAPVTATLTPVGGGPPVAPLHLSSMGPHLPSHLGPPNMPMSPIGSLNLQTMGIGSSPPIRLPMTGSLLPPPPPQIPPHAMGPGPHAYHHGPMASPIQNGPPLAHSGPSSYPSVGPATSPQPNGMPVTSQVPTTGE